MLPFSEACERNKGPILAVLTECFAQRTQVLEIGSGTGQHAVYFARHLTHLTWHPTEQLTYLPDLSGARAARGRQQSAPADASSTFASAFGRCARSMRFSRPTRCTSCRGPK